MSSGQLSFVDRQHGMTLGPEAPAAQHGMTLGPEALAAQHKMELGRAATGTQHGVGPAAGHTIADLADDRCSALAPLARAGPGD
ncbi:MAG TPA: hypothetical protein VIX82_17615 [Solirubrobacteraceae bacterium]